MFFPTVRSDAIQHVQGLVGLRNRRAGGIKEDTDRVVKSCAGSAMGCEPSPNTARCVGAHGDLRRRRLYPIGRHHQSEN
jgi:hypothetical protein